MAATYLVGKGMMEAGAAALTEGLVFMKKLGGFIAGLAKGIGKKAYQLFVALAVIP